MYDKALGYLISLGILCVGLMWIVVARDSATSAIWLTIGVLTLAVGLFSFITLLRRRSQP
jgi:phosphate starvation-inducible membrane PsiE